MGSVGRRPESLQEINTDGVMELIILMRDEMGRLPTDDEVIDFIFGDDELRKKIINGQYS